MALIAAAQVLPASAMPDARLAYESQVVSIVVTGQGYEPWRPWEKKTPDTRTVQAVVVDGHALLTTADNIEDATIFMVEKHGRPIRETGRIVHLDADANLALLTVDKPGYFEDLKPVPLSAVAPVDGQADSVRWRSGQLEASSSRISRVEVGATFLAALEHASLQVETDLSAGGWSEPVFAGGRLIGLTDSQEGQHAIVTPVDVLRSYLEAARSSGKYREFANLDFTWQTNRDPVLTRPLGLQGE